MTHTNSNIKNSEEELAMKEKGREIHKEEIKKLQKGIANLEKKSIEEKLENLAGEKQISPELLKLKNPTNSAIFMPEDRNHKEVTRVKAHGTTLVALFYRNKNKGKIIDEGVLLGMDSRITFEELVANIDYDPETYVLETSSDEEIAGSIKDDVDKSKIFKEAGIIAAYCGTKATWKKVSKHVENRVKEVPNMSVQMVAEEFKDNIVDVCTTSKGKFLDGQDIDILVAGCEEKTKTIRVFSIEGPLNKKVVVPLEFGHIYTALGEGTDVANKFMSYSASKRIKSLSAALPIATKSILRAALSDPTTGGFVKVFQVSANSKNIEEVWNQSLLEWYCSDVENIDPKNRPLILLCRISDGVSPEELESHVTTTVVRDGLVSVQSTVILGRVCSNKFYLYRMLFASTAQSRTVLGRLKSAHVKGRYEAMKEMYCTVMFLGQKRVTVYAELATRRLLRQL